MGHNATKHIAGEVQEKHKAQFQYKMLSYKWHSSRTVHAIHDFSEACPPPSPQQNINLHLLQSVDTQKSLRIHPRPDISALYLNS